MIKTVIICDRCGRQYDKTETYDGTMIEPRILFTYRENRFSDKRIKKDYDLCPSCSHTISDWLDYKKIVKIEKEVKEND